MNCVNSLPQLLRCDSEWKRNWIKIKAIGVKSNRTGIGARVKVVAKTDPKAPKTARCRSMRCGAEEAIIRRTTCDLHFGLDQATSVDLVEIRWPSGQVDSFKDLGANKLYTLLEGGKLLSAEALTGFHSRGRRS